ncbi:MAG: hypothetical protein ACR2FY_10720 [Pirellulaceae bacterium]
MTASIPVTYLTPAHGVPTRATLSQSLDFNVPKRFADFARQLFEFTNGDPERCLDAFDATLGLFPSGRNARYCGTPPELFPIGSTGCDGDHYGFLLHAPELELDELPYGHYCPMDSDGVILVGSTTIQGIASKMARCLSYDFEPPEKKKLIAEIARVCNIRPEEEANPAISIPSGWSFLPSSDGVGTLAPANLFAPQPVIQIDRYGPPAPFEEAANQAMRRGYLATALHYLREGLWYCWVTKPYDLARRMVDVYNKMNRAKLGIELTYTMSRWSDTA